MLQPYRVEGAPVCQASGDAGYSVIDPFHKGQSLFASASGLPLFGNEDVSESSVYLTMPQVAF